MPPKSSTRAPAPGTNFAQQNRQQILEQQAINRERVKQDEFAQERKQRLIERQKSQYGQAQRQPVAPARGNAPREDPSSYGAQPVQDNQEITVFVRECDVDAHSYVQHDSYGQQQNRAPQQEPMRGAPAAPRGIAREQRTGGAPQAAAVSTAQRASVGSRGQPAGSAASTASGVAPSRGQVPEYLRQRKAELQQEKDEAKRLAEIQQEQSKYPPGHRPVSEEERQEVLARLQQRKKELEADLGRLPMRFDTQAIAQRRKQIETELLEVETAQQKFSVKKQLYVPV